jgi:hypothetical protein
VTGMSSISGLLFIAIKSLRLREAAMLLIDVNSVKNQVP